MKKLFWAAAILVAAAACTGKQPVDVYVPKGNMEFAGNGFDTFSLGSDVHLYMSPSEADASQWVVQAVVPVKKETEAIISGLVMDMTLLDDKGVRVRDSFVLQAEDMENLLPVFNASPTVEKTMVFSVPEEGGKKVFPYKQAKAMLEASKNIRLNINLETIQPEPVVEVAEEPAANEPAPYTFNWLIKRMNVNGVIARYEKAVRNGNKRMANEVEAELYAIEKQVKEDDRVTDAVKKRFVSYIEGKIESIDDKY